MDPAIPSPEAPTSAQSAFSPAPERRPQNRLPTWPACIRQFPATEPNWSLITDWSITAETVVTDSTPRPYS